VGEEAFDISVLGNVDKIQQAVLTKFDLLINEEKVKWTGLN
jgi:hypothetical protein